MNTIDYIFRYDLEKPNATTTPPDVESAKAKLEQGNRIFADWVDSCRRGILSDGEPRYVFPCNHLGQAMGWAPGESPKQQPFAVVLGCSDARVPLEMVLGQSLNELFVVRVAGNVADSAGQGSIDFALDKLGSSVRLIVVMGHANCGGVTAAVDAYLNPIAYWDEGLSHPLRSIVRRIVVVVREAATVLEKRYGTDVAKRPGYRQALIDLSVCLNAAQTAYDLRPRESNGAGYRADIGVFFGVYDLGNGEIRLPGDPDGLPDGEGLLLPAPARTSRFLDLADRVAARLASVIEGEGEG